MWVEVESVGGFEFESVCGFEVEVESVGGWVGNKCPSHTRE